MKLATSIAVLSALALVGAGCGGDDDDNGALSYEDTGAEISAICAGVDDLGQGLTGDPQNDAPILEDAAPDFEAAINEVRDLEVNEELAAARDAFVANGEEQLALVEKAVQEAEAGDKKAYVKTLESGQEIDRESNDLANELGAEECLSD